jgi:hypothetical protein
VLIQLVWKAPVEPSRRDILSSHLGVRPLMLVEWKRLLREAGLEDLHSEDWSDAETAFRPQIRKPFPDFAELFSLPEKLGILRRARGKWGWRGVVTAVLRESEVHRLLTRERILGLDLLLGRKPPVTTIESGVDSAGESAVDVEPAVDVDPAVDVEPPPERAREPEGGPEHEPEPPADPEHEPEPPADPEPDPAVEDLPLFQKKSHET